MAETRAPVARPLSPHLQIYRWTWTMAMSIAHRVTGAALYGGVAAARRLADRGRLRPGRVRPAQWLAGSWLGRLVLFGYTYALFHHMVGGVRHFIWDTGRGFEPRRGMNLARMTPFVAARADDRRLDRRLRGALREGAMATAPHPHAARQVRGLGPARSGTGHFWLQRLTAVANLFLAFAFIAILIVLSGTGLRRRPRAAGAAAGGARCWRCSSFPARSTCASACR